MAVGIGIGEHIELMYYSCQEGDVTFSRGLIPVARRERRGRAPLILRRGPASADLRQHERTTSPLEQGVFCEGARGTESRKGGRVDMVGYNQGQDD